MQISDNVMLLGNGHFNHYIVGRSQAALLECGMSAGIPAFIRQWESLNPQPQVTHILVLHSHFDHVCGLPSFKKMFPQAQVLGHAAAEKLLAKEKVRQLMQMGDEMVSQVYFEDHRISEKPVPPDIALLQIDQTVGEGDTISLGSGLTLQIIETPGHSSCSISVYLPEEEVMFVSDAAGTAINEGIIAPVFFQDYDLYLDSLRKLMNYPTRVLALGHGPVISGYEQVQDFYQRSLQSAQDAFAAIKEELLAGANHDALTKKFYDQYIKGGLADYPVQIMLASVGQLINNVAKRM
ncbi:MAG TPA: MBL fold metallo-hydrolase [Syntrophomonadaceae bacterium]|nr:MBL fold metallo-hydrolase [Syntrophomonadaceae bacterium]HOQ09448.1 MBL fold metallo-hydrolase [Syntrophomonadaceae bacterium]HPU48282.1 MBL fold metallo-hydrolase [Syntrophomonadaceae bacterium]